MATNNNAYEVVSEIYKRYQEYSQNYAETNVRRANDGCQFLTSREHETPQMFLSVRSACQPSVYQRTEQISPLAPHRQAPRDHVIYRPNITAWSLATPLQPQPPPPQPQPQSCTINALVSSPPEFILGQAHGGDIKEELREKKRIRTKFTASQKNQMKEFANKLGWKISGNDEDEICKFCSGIGVTTKNLKVWMNNNKFKLKN